jgi:hypothetical protein
MATLTLVLLFSALLTPEQETRPVPADSVEIGTRGCLNGRVFTAVPRLEGEGVVLGPDVTGWNFRVSGSRSLLEDVKKYNGKLVEVVGLVKKSALTRSGPGTGAGVTMSAPRSDPTRPNSGAAPVGGLAVMDLTSIRFLSDTCPIR